MALLACGRYEEARDEFREALRLEPTFVVASGLLGLTLWLEGQPDEAVAVAERALAIVPTDPGTRGILAALLQDRDPARGAEMLAMLEQPRYGASIGRLTYYTMTGDVDRAADAAEEALAEQYPATLLYLRLPHAAPIRASARWPALARLMNLPDGVR